MRGDWVLLVGFVASLVRTQPYEAYAANKQLPPVAIAGEAFSFKLSNDTFKSSVDEATQIQYEAYDLPSWLEFDSENRVLSGTPAQDGLGQDSDASYVSYTLQGIDPADNGALNKTYKLALSDASQSAVASSFNLLSLLKNSGYTNGKNALKLSPGEIFNVSFDRDTFANSSSSTAFYGRSALYHAPLPSWIFFDESSLKFSGTAPVVNSEIAPESYFSFSLIASDVNGYTSSEVVFDLVVGAHQFTTSIQNTLVVNVSSLGHFDYKLPMNYVYLDDEPVSQSNISSIQLLDAPDWASVSNQSLSGTLPTGESSKNLTIAIEDVYGDAVYLNFLVESTSKLFAVSSLPNVNATKDEWFQYSLLPSQFTDYDNTNVSVSFSNSSDSSSWLSFHSSNLTLMGKVPDDFTSLTVDVSAKQSSEEQKLSFRVLGVPSLKKTSSSTSTQSSKTATSSATSSASSPTATSTQTQTASPAAETKKKSSNKRSTAIACGVAIPVAVILALILFLLLWRRKKNKSGAAEDQENTPRISNPQLGNPANNPNVIGAVSPFGDENSLDDSSTAKRLAALNGMKLDAQGGSGSDGSTMDEKAECGSLSSSSSDSYHDAAFTSSTDALVPRDESDQYFDSNKHTSSVYLNSEPTNRKSWRFSAAGAAANRNTRESYNSLNTVSTAELFNTQIAGNKSLPKDPRKSSLGMRDSVFMGNPPSSARGTRDGLQSNSGSLATSNVAKSSEGFKESTLPHLKENPHDESSFHSQITASSSDDFIPVKNGDNYTWIERINNAAVQTPERKRSLKRLVSLPNKSGVGVCDANDIQGQEPEMDASMD
ncbi:LAQU0S11e00496g1_1 [Lachancea quebecensis]|uniref:LAQU0S11e00496g1_1 n=1 Tax=Lachancea quebecensis TaxID=1654605 RepID=A0A0P1KUT0_9SACH|nr:LAQU0S11e00496g1_1 [Lachancea quebecensis]